MAAGFFELAIQMAAEGHQVKSFLTILERPGFALVVSPASSRKISRIEDLRGAAVGVSTPGSASHQLVNYLLARHHVRLEDVSVVGIGLGPTAVAAMERGRIDAAVLIGSAVTTIERRFPTAMLLADTRTSDGVREIFGTDVYPSHSLLATAQWLRANEDTAGKLTWAVKRAMKWMREHSPEEIRNRMPLQY